MFCKSVCSFCVRQKSTCIIPYCSVLTFKHTAECFLWSVGHLLVFTQILIDALFSCRYLHELRHMNVYLVWFAQSLHESAHCCVVTQMLSKTSQQLWYLIQTWFACAFPMRSLSKVSFSSVRLMGYCLTSWFDICWCTVQKWNVLAQWVVWKCLVDNTI